MANEANIRLSQFGPVRQAGAQLSRTAIWLAAVEVAIAFVVVVAIFSTVAYVVAYWGFRLSRQPGGTLYIVRGLLTRRSITLEERRLRGAEVSEPLLVRAVGGARAVAALRAEDRFRSLGHALAGHVLVVRQGSLVRRRVMLVREGVIGWNLRQSLFQRRAGVVTLEATTAGGRQRYAALDVPVDVAVRLADEAVPGLLTPFLADYGSDRSSD